MSEMVQSSRVTNLGRRDKKKGGSTQQLTFHLPEGMKANISVVLEITPIVEPTFRQIEQAQVEAAAIEVEKPRLRVVHDAQDLQELKIVENLAPEVAVIEALVPTSAISNEVRIEVEEVESFEIPFFSLKLKNSASVYKIGTSYLKDINEGKKHFGFASTSKSINDLHLLVYASFINYSLKKPVLIVVKDINDKSFDKFRANFTEGTLWKWQTSDWGNLCFVDYRQINAYSDELKNIDLDCLLNEFSSVLWSLPCGDVQNELQKSSIIILDKIDSITFVISQGETKNNVLKKAVTYFQCFDIPVKGILVGENSK